MSVHNINDFKDVNMHKIEGEGFQRIKDLRYEHTNKMKALLEQVSASHEALWDEIYKEIGRTKKEGVCLSLDHEFEELGFYVVKKAKKNPLEGILGSLLDNI